jgi:hypothetical protein
VPATRSCCFPGPPGAIPRGPLCGRPPCPRRWRAAEPRRRAFSRGLPSKRRSSTQNQNFSASKLARPLLTSSGMASSGYYAQSDHLLLDPGLSWKFSPPFGGGSLTPTRLAFDRPMVIACWGELAPCFPSRTCSISSRTNSPACGEGDFPLQHHGHAQLRLFLALDRILSPSPIETSLELGCN